MYISFYYLKILLLFKQHICSLNNFLSKVHELSPEKLKTREVVYIDIANDPIPSSDYKPDLDPTTFKSEKTGRGPLTGPKWWLNQKPMMTCYKLVTVEFKWFGLQVYLCFNSVLCVTCNFF